MSAALELAEITVRYGDQVALRKVDLVARPGRMVAVTGASGAGKTTLLWTAAGLVEAAQGTVTVGGKAVVDHDRATEAGVVLIPQGNGLASVLTARENLMVALLARGLAPQKAAERSLEALAWLGIDGQADQLAEELSGGQRQRVAIVRGLAMRAKVLLADEITSDLDSANRDLALELLRREADRGATVVLATHDAQAAAVCDTEIRLRDGFAEPVRHSK